MVPGREAVRVCRRFRDQGMAFRQFDLLTVAVMTQVASLVADPGWYPSHIELQSSGPLGPVDRAVFGDAVISAGQPVTSIAIPRRYLARPLHLPHAAADDHDGGSAWLRSAPPADFPSSSRVLVEVLLRGARSEVADAAKAAGMSVRSFQRHLAESGTSYSALVDEARLATATRLLADRDVKIIEIALALGYSDPAHFTRAFRRWTAVSPVAYRRALLERELAA
jgi:AraC-like DNA-binding protein